MSTSAIGAQSGLAIQQLVAMRNQFNDLETQLSTGQKSQTYAGLGIDRGVTVSLNAQLSALNGYDSTITTASTRIDLMNTALTSMTQVGSTVLCIYADDTDFVKAGQPLVQLDPADAKVALDQAEAALGQAVRQVRTLYANNNSLAAQVQLRTADIAKAQADVARAADDLNRRQSLAGNGAVSKEELNHAATQLANAKSAGEFFRHVAEDLDTRRVCGLGPMYSLLTTIDPHARAHTLAYEQTIDPDEGSIVSHAALAYLR